MSFQSLLESTECGTTNPMVDLSRQLATGSGSAANAPGVAAGVLGTGGHSDILSLDELTALNNPSAVESLLFQNNETGTGISGPQQPFNMESLLDEINRMESTRLNDVNELNATSQSQQTIGLKPDSNDPLISNLPESVEEDFWHEATGNLNDSVSGGNKLPELNVDWAEEYLRNLEMNNNNSLKSKQTSSDNVWDLDEPEFDNSQTSNASYRNRPVPENVVDSFFAQPDPTNAGQGGFLPFLRHSNQNAQQPEMMISDANLNDLVSDQESRLINMLLGNNNPQQKPEQQSESNLEKESEVESVKLHAKNLEDQEVLKNVEQSEIEQQQESATKQEPEQIQLPESESLFYENQFDDMEFWMKLAEEWHSTANDATTSGTDELLPGGDILGGTPAKPIIIRESLDELLDPKHAYHYKFVDENPFLVRNVDKENQSEEENSKQEKIVKIDYIGEGLTRMKAGDLSGAVLMFEAATQSNPEDKNAWRLLGVANAKNENDHKSIAAMKRCLALMKPEALNDSDIEIQLDSLMYLATGFTNESMTNEACYALQEWLKQHPKYKHLVRDPAEMNQKNEPYMGPTPLSQRWTNQTLGNNIFSDGFFESVKQSFLDAAQQSPDQPDPDIQCGLGVLHNISGEYSKAIDCYRAALQSRPEDYCLWNRYGASLANGGRAEESMFAYREALIRYPGYIRARYNLAVSCIMLGTGMQAAEHLLAILNLQTAGADSVKDLVSLNRDNITSGSVWNLMRAALMMQGRVDLMAAVDERNLELLNKELSKNKVEEQSSAPETEQTNQDNTEESEKKI